MSEENKDKKDENSSKDNDDSVDEKINVNVLQELCHHEENFICHCVCTCEAFEEAHPMSACIAPMWSHDRDCPDFGEHECVCGDNHGAEEIRCNHEERQYAEERLHAEERQHAEERRHAEEEQHDDDIEPEEEIQHNNEVLEHDGECVYHCVCCGVQLAPLRNPDGRRSPIPEELEPEYNNDDNRAGSPPPIVENNENDPIIEPPLPPPPPPVLPGSSRMTYINTTMTPMTLMKVLSCDDGSPSDTRLHEAARAGNLEKLRHLLENENLSNNINYKIRPLMATPLREAVAGGNLECVKLLLSKGAKVDEVDVKGQTPLFFAASCGMVQIMEELLEKGADPEGSEQNTCTPLVLCVRDGCTRGVEVLLNHGVDPQPVSLTTTCVPGWPLQHSIVYRHYDCFLALLKAGAETSLLKVMESKLKNANQSLENLDRGITNRLSITRTVLRHARESPEFLLTFREFGGDLEALENLPENMKTECPSLDALKSSLETPLSLRSLCRRNLCLSLGTKKMKILASSFMIPKCLVEYLHFSDC